MRWMAEMDAWMLENVPGRTSWEAMDMFEERFGIELTLSQFKNRKSRLGVGSGLHVGTSGKHRGVWSNELAAFIKEFVPGHTEPEIRAAVLERFGVELNRSQIKNAKTRYGVKSGTCGGRFEPGHEWTGFNGEEHRRAFLEAGKATRFKKGQMSEHNRRELGDRRVTRDGYIEVKVKDGLQDAPNDNWRMEHRVVWEQAHGPLGEHDVVVHLNGDKADNRLENLAVCKRGEWAVIKRNHLPYCDLESFGCAVLQARIMSARYRRGKEGK